MVNRESIRTLVEQFVEDLLEEQDPPMLSHLQEIQFEKAIEDITQKFFLKNKNIDDDEESKITIMDLKKSYDESELIKNSRPYEYQANKYKLIGLLCGYLIERDMPKDGKEC